MSTPVANLTYVCVCVWCPSRVLLETCSGLVIKQQNVTCECSMSNPHAVPAGLVPTVEVSDSGVCMFYFGETRSHLAQVGLKLTMQPGQP